MEDIEGVCVFILRWFQIHSSEMFLRDQNPYQMCEQGNNNRTPEQKIKWAGYFMKFKYILPVKISVHGWQPAMRLNVAVTQEMQIFLGVLSIKKLNYRI